MTTNSPSLTDFPYASKYVEVNGSKMHYIEQGNGDPIIFLHGIPTWSYLWRNIIPFLSPYARCIAVDLIGLGKSDKPEIDYTVSDHINYFEGFIEALGLENMTLVMHAWGSVIGLDYAMHHEDKIKALAFMESQIRPSTTKEMVSLPIQELTSIIDMPDGGYDIIMNSNYFINKVLPAGILRKLTNTEIQAYQMPFQTAESCKPLWQYLQDLPLGKGPSKTVDLIANYSKKLEQSQLPKLMLYAVPGFITTIDTVIWAKEHLPNLRQVDIGEALHYAQESNPQLIGEELRDWYTHIIKVEDASTTHETSTTA